MLGILDILLTLVLISGGSLLLQSQQSSFFSGSRKTQQLFQQNSEIQDLRSDGLTCQKTIFTVTCAKNSGSSFTALIE